MKPHLLMIDSQRFKNISLTKDAGNLNETDGIHNRHPLVLAQVRSSVVVTHRCAVLSISAFPNRIETSATTLDNAITANSSNAQLISVIKYGHLTTYVS